jgi:hypothetical protein
VNSGSDVSAAMGRGLASISLGQRFTKVNKF